MVSIRWCMGCLKGSWGVLVDLHDKHEAGLSFSIYIYIHINTYCRTTAMNVPHS